MTTEAKDLIDEVPEGFTTLQQTDAVFYSPSLSGELYTGPQETHEARVAIAALTNVVNAAHRASHAANLAMSWRKYNVGATAIMVNLETGMMGYLDGYNVKPVSGPSDLNIHAEQMAISKGRRTSLDRVVAISVFAEPKDEDANPGNLPTLPPCGRCVTMFSEIPEVDQRTIVLGTNPATDVCELYTVGSLLQPGTERLVNEPFSLRSEDDLEYYDRNIKTQLVPKIFELYGAAL